MPPVAARLCQSKSDTDLLTPFPQLKGKWSQSAVVCSARWRLLHKRQFTAHRFALWALSKEYDADVECEGPVVKGVKVKGDKMVVSFKNSKGLYVRGDAGVRYLHIAGADGVYYPAQSKIEKGKLVAWSPSVPKPVHIRYCTEDYCCGTIYNEADLPAYPFEY